MRKLPYVGDRIVFPGNSIDYLYQRHVVRQLLASCIFSTTLNLVICLCWKHRPSGHLHTHGLTSLSVPWQRCQHRRAHNEVAVQNMTSSSTSCQRRGHQSESYRWCHCANNDKRQRLRWTWYCSMTSSTASCNYSSDLFCIISLTNFT